jgi:prephenate dehydratase
LDIEARAADPAMAGAIRDLEGQGAVVIVLGDYPRFTPRA